MTSHTDTLRAELAAAAERDRIQSEAVATQVARNAAAAERVALATACVVCAKPSQHLGYVGTTEGRRLEGYKEGLVAYLCYGCRCATEAEWQRRAGTEMVNGRTRTELAADYLDRAAG